MLLAVNKFLVVDCTSIGLDFVSLLVSELLRLTIQSILGLLCSGVVEVD